ncbi:hypothetical protein PTSG_08868 [Salpingoeca rosetta]|uniref:TMC domain-containing protein n=1 Tax=Salpingoeca rosetta (strain ATCC 50818 / BSB-021) TaxID=946362 RepID=F2UKX9_SALR5|nr:uncharacterized protein PTSG_08868 [Salpingoeca rosetta]EGD77778.1 hypothetical protein PTSG_08868 [Salpingoeca rosetta]|eukprot:XP_004990254.1 hypothetical protein PTSG_08868 [Salpingoeca rosetta]
MSSSHDDDDGESHEMVEFEENPLARDAPPPQYQPTPRFSSSHEHTPRPAGNDRSSARRKSSRFDLVDIVNMLPSQSPAAKNLQLEATFNELAFVESDDPVAATMGRITSRQSKQFSRQATRRRTSLWGGDEELNKHKRQLDNIKKKPHRMSIKIQEARVDREGLKRVQSQISGWQWFIAEYSVRWRRFRQRIWDAVMDAQIWNTSIKILEGRHGAAVGTYFRFLRLNFIINIILGICYVSFGIVPYAILQGYDTAENVLMPSIANDSYTAEEVILGLFSGGGVLNNSAYFLGSMTFSQDIYTASESYDFTLAYLMVTGAMLILLFLYITKEVATNIYGAASYLDEGQHPISEIVFSSYDHTVLEPDAVVTKQRAIARELLEHVFEQQSMEEYAKKDQQKLLLKRIGVTCMVLVILVLSFWAITVAVTRFATSTNALEQLIPSIVLSLLNQAVPISFEILSRFEEWPTPLKTIKWTVVRSIVLRIGSLYAFFYTYFLQRRERMCWESYVGQQMYSVLVISFVVEIVTSIAIDPVRKALYEKTSWFKRYLPTARFQTIKCTLEMLWTQAMVWFGMFFCPLLPLLGALKHFVLFYLKKWSTMTFCAPPVRLFRATYSLGSVMSFMMLITIVCMTIPLGYTITRIAPSGLYQDEVDVARWIDPTALGNTSCTGADELVSCSDCLVTNFTASTDPICYKVDNTPFEEGVQTTASVLCSNCPSGCGPYRNYDTVYEVLLIEYDSWPYGVRVVLQYIGTVAFGALLFLGLLTWILINRAVIRAQKKLINKLQVERDLERMDKIWILNKWSITLDDNADDEDRPSAWRGQQS